MREAYKEAMDHITVTEEMRARILTNLQSADFSGAKKRPGAIPTRYLAAAACLALFIAGTIAFSNFHTPMQTEQPSGVQSGILDRVEVNSVEELAQCVGFEVELLNPLPFDVTEMHYTAYGRELAEVKYMGDTQSLVFRKASGSADPSGDYTAYSDTLLLELGGGTVTLKGTAQGYCLALWQDETYSYSVQSSTALSDVEWREILEAFDG